jgi:hypothetical protein
LRNAAVSGEAAVGRIESRQAADLPCAGDQALPTDLHFGIAKGRAPGECANDLFVHTITLAVLNPCDRAPDQGSARGAFDPRDLSAGAALPPEQGRCFLRNCRRGGRPLRFAAAAPAFNPCNDVAERGRGRALGLRPGRLCSGRFVRRRDERRVSFRGSEGIGMKRLDELTGLLVGERQQRAPLRGVQRCGSEHRGGNRQAIRNEIFEQPDRQRPTGNGARGGGPEVLLDAPGFRADRVECSSDDGTRALGPCARDEIHELPPTHCCIVAVARGLAQYGQQSIVETHL